MGLRSLRDLVSPYGMIAPDQLAIRLRFVSRLLIACIIEPMLAETLQRLRLAAVQPNIQPLQALLIECMLHDFPHQDVAQIVPIISRWIDDG